MQGTPFAELSFEDYAHPIHAHALPHGEGGCAAHGAAGRRRDPHAVNTGIADVGLGVPAGLFLGDNRGWGFGVSVVTRRDDVSSVPGRYGWDGGFGTSWSSDPREQVVAILLTQRLWDSPRPPRVYLDFWTSAYQTIDD